MSTRKTIFLGLVGIIFVSFFLPWIAVESQAVGTISKMLTGKKQAQIDTVSGFRVPLIANSEESRLMVSVIKIFQPNIKDADKKSYLIWIVPLLAIGMFMLDRALKNRWVVLMIGIVGILIFGVATFKIITTDLDKLVLNVKIGYGLWLILIGYLAIGILEISSFIRTVKK